MARSYRATDSTEGRKPLTVAERQARHRNRIAARTAGWHAALEAIYAAKTICQAREIAWVALTQQPQENQP